MSYTGKKQGNSWTRHVILLYSAFWSCTQRPPARPNDRTNDCQSHIHSYTDWLTDSSSRAIHGNALVSYSSCLVHASWGSHFVTIIAYLLSLDAYNCVSLFYWGVIILYHILELEICCVYWNRKVSVRLILYTEMSLYWDGLYPRVWRSSLIECS